MAQKRITQLQLRSSVSDDCNIPVDDGTQSYRVTALQFVSYILGAGVITRSMLTPAERLPVGTVLITAGSTADTGFLYTDGSAISRTTYAALFAKIGTVYGVGDGSTTFNLPNTAGVFPKFAGTQTITSKSFSATLGAKVRDSTALPINGFQTGNESSSHTHALTALPSTSGTTSDPGRGSGIPSTSYSTGTQSATHTHVVTIGGDTHTQPGHIVFNAQIKY